MTGALTVTGTRAVGSEPDEWIATSFERFLAPFAGPGTTVYVGGAAGIDSSALAWLARHSVAALVVVVPGTVADQPDVAASAIRLREAEGRIARVVELGARRVGTAAYHARNRWMVDRSDVVIGFPRGNDRASGTWYTLDYAAGLGLPRMVVPV
ncbi:DNA-processing protein DprA [Pseudonocardia sp. HH130630-07]|uniref:DNA-processing protein DprA n=1 Tax=Pseudonocardia sp. HH130630-07 TaxID=1690815 RepID=UPI0008151434|nr:DNA-processing protein DprA [Pseudonocardia sp. HH130630-07]ANY08698.1 hypothetical protein AFB00_23260 [Pseudonocardia sp. HH130630-07]